MTKLTIDDALLNSLVHEVAPLVSAATGWDLHLNTLGSRALPKDRGFEEIVLGRLKGMDLQAWKALMPDFLEIFLEYMLEGNILAAYMPGSEEILVVQENVDDINLDGLKLVLAHELVHRGQHMTHGELFIRLDTLLHKAFAEMSSEATDFVKLRLYFEEVQPIMTLLESHAAYIQEIIKQRYLPEARVESHFNLAILLMRLIGAPKVAQYTEGLPEISAAIDSGRIESLLRG